MTPVAALVMMVGIFASVMMSATAIASGLNTNPVRNCTLSRSTSSSANCFERAGSMPPSSRITISTGPEWDWSHSVAQYIDQFDDPTAASDLATFSAQYGIPCNGCLQKVNQTGGTIYPAANSGWSLEIALDIETAHGICPNCTILLVEANSNSFNDLNAAENETVALGADVISNSWGANEFSSETSLDGFYNHPGIPITVSTGDSGYGVEYPAASRYVTAVGGTSLHVNPDGTWASETAWSGAGSGCSGYESKPSWQTDTGCGRRSVADVSADADPNTGAAVYDTTKYQGLSGWYPVGGTSLAAPLIAAVYALAGNAAPQEYPAKLPYSNRSSLHDVTSGASTGNCATIMCRPAVGYDGPSGVGSPNGLGAF